MGGEQRASQNCRPTRPSLERGAHWVCGHTQPSVERGLGMGQPGQPALPRGPSPTCAECGFRGRKGGGSKGRWRRGGVWQTPSPPFCSAPVAGAGPHGWAGWVQFSSRSSSRSMDSRWKDAMLWEGLVPASSGPVGKSLAGPCPQGNKRCLSISRSWTT